MQWICYLLTLVLQYMFNSVQTQNITVKTWHTDFLKSFFSNVRGYSNYKPTNIYSCSNGEEKCCNCDDLCYYRNDCCIDKDFFNNPLPPDLYLQYLQTREYSRSFTCNPVIKSDVKKHEIENVYMVTTCQSAKRETCYSNRNTGYNPALSFPVISELGVVYLNEDCAKCNYIQEYQQVVIKITGCVNTKLETKIKVNENELDLRKKRCYIYVDKTNFDIKSCSEEETRLLYPKEKGRKCSDVDFKLCKSYLAISIDDFDQYWANPHCIKCLKTKTKPKVGQCIQKFQNGSFSSKWKEEMYDTTLTLQGATDAMLFTKSTGIKSFINICPPGKMFDIRYAKCISVSCEKHQIHNGRNCINLPNTGIFLQVFECLQKSAFNVIIVLNSYNCTDQFDMFERDEFRIGKKIYLFLSGSEPIMNFIYSSINWACVDKIYFTPLQKMPYTKKYGFDLNHSLLYGRKCYRYVVYKLNRISKSCNMILSDEEMLPSKSMYWVEKTEAGETSYATVCSELYLEPTACVLEKHKTNFEFYPNQTAWVNFSGIKELFMTDQYLPIETGIATCARNKVKHYKWQEDLFIEKTLICTIVSLISIVSLFMTLFTYGCIKKYYQSLGKIFASLTVMMICHYFVYLTLSLSDFSNVLSKKLVLVLHWLSLTKHLWVVMMTFELYKINKAKRNQPIYEYYFQFLVYNIFVYVTATGVVVACLAIDDRKHYQMKEMKSNFIRSMHGPLDYYLIPSFVIYIINIFVLVFVLRKVFTTENVTTITRMELQKIAYMIIRIVCVIGFVEILGLVYITPSTERRLFFNEIFQFVFCLFRGAEGVFIFLILVFKSSIYKAYREYFNQKLNGVKPPEIMTNRTDISNVLATNRSDVRKELTFDRHNAIKNNSNNGKNQNQKPKVKAQEMVTLINPNKTNNSDNNEILEKQTTV